MTHDAIVLAGGAGRRMGGAVKAQVELGGRRLLDHVLEATTQARSVVVVAPEAVPVPAGTLRTLEDPPLGGPVAGIAAGLAAIEQPAPWVLVLACDAPGAAAAVPRLLAQADTSAVDDKSAAGDTGALPSRVESGVVMVPSRVESRVVMGSGGVVLRDGEGRDQWLLGVYASGPLRARVAEVAAGRGLRGCPVRQLVAPLRLRSVPALGAEGRDVDTWADLAAAAEN